MKKAFIFNLFVFSLLAVFSTETLQAQTPKVTVNADSQIDDLLKIKKELEKDNKLADGYTIQLYYGDLNGANSVKKKYRMRYGSWPASIEYETPNYKVWAGNFSSRLEADRALLEIQKEFGSAFILEKKK
ncbi:MAG: SPOR domain-containing protein [Patiriisocius sp.]|uniref:SPOR domain-containing protein n=1 Tax=Patiriisocius sp. TaxID=2822396 RepID=UPI003EF3E5C7